MYIEGVACETCIACTMITYKESESTYFQYQNALALVLSAAQHYKFKEEDSHEAERGCSGIYM